MRHALAPHQEKRITVLGQFARFGTKPGWQGSIEKTVLLLDLTDARTHQPLCDHLWMNYTKALAALDLQPGDTVQFDARVTKYLKGYQGRREDIDAPLRRDYKLSYPTKVRKLGSAEPDAPLFVETQICPGLVRRARA